MNGLPDHPAIRNAERTGYGDGKVPEYPHCPRCGSECSTIYYARKEIIGCDECVTTGDAWNEDECFEERN